MQTVGYTRSKKDSGIFKFIRFKLDKILLKVQLKKFGPRHLLLGSRKNECITVKNQDEVNNRFFVIFCPVFCSQSSKYRNDSSELHIEIYWNCTGHSKYIFMSCKGSQERKKTLDLSGMSCQASFEEENNRATRAGIW